MKQMESSLVVRINNINAQQKLLFINFYCANKAVNAHKHAKLMFI